LVIASDRPRNCRDVCAGAKKAQNFLRPCSFKTSDSNEKEVSQLKNSSKKSLEKRGIQTGGRALNAPSASVHADKRHPKRSARKRELKQQMALETARNRGPFPFFRRRGGALPIRRAFSN